MVNLQDDISLKVQDLFGSVSIIINITVILYFLYISKFIDIYDEAYVKKIKSAANSTQGSKNTLNKGSNSNLMKCSSLSSSQLSKIHSNNAIIKASPSFNQIYNPIIKSNSSFNLISNPTFHNSNSQNQLFISQNTINNSKVFVNNHIDDFKHKIIQDL
ncbi:hypothetical protein PIROE2DRAFT_1346 [Piromyces sp. E2]|nr:hypothetical protein PIROE2DRAFT_1346 [Piromyces sp. E2]|eukprot:OUM70480.1 hypothetical protein PIROE2DRAFT_1346 [Piromyces sp. E2]